MLTYETEGNGFTIEIFDGDSTEAFYQGEQAEFLLKALDETQTDAQEQFVLANHQDVITIEYDRILGGRGKR